MLCQGRSKQQVHFNASLLSCLFITCRCSSTAPFTWESWNAISSTSRYGRTCDFLSFFPHDSDGVGSLSTQTLSRALSHGGLSIMATIADLLVCELKLLGCHADPCAPDWITNSEQLYRLVLCFSDAGSIIKLVAASFKLDLQYWYF